MTNRDVYDAALALLAEEQDELCEDYAQRAPYILATFFNECREVNAFYRYARHGTVCDGADGELNTELDAEFPLAERFFSAGAFYLAAMLVELENEELCKITDFGTSKAVSMLFTVTMTKGQGTPLYMAPEMLGGQKKYNKSVDVYSFGVLSSVVWNNGGTPYAEHSFANPLDLQNAVLAGCRPQLPADCPIAPLIHQCWSGNPADRPPFDAICEALR